MNKNTNYKVGIVAGVKNDAEILRLFIEHHLQMGFHKIHLADFNSTDGSKEILLEYIDHPQVDVFFSDVDNGTPDIQQLFRLRAFADAHTDYMLYLDVDEFVVTEPKTSIQNILNELPSSCYEIPRYNVVLPVKLREGLGPQILQNLHRLYYFTPQGPSTDYPLSDVSKEWIRWIQQPILAKSLHIKSPVHISVGGHFVYGPKITRYVWPKGIFIAHFPVTTHSRMKRKLYDFKNLISALSHLKKSLFTRYIHLCHALDTDKTEALYNEMFLSKESIKHRIQLGLITSGQHLLHRPAKLGKGDVSHLGIFHELNPELVNTKLAQSAWSKDESKVVPL